MVWERFEEIRKSSKDPTVTLTKFGQLFINRTCFEKYLSNFKHIVLYYEPEGKKIGIKPTEKKTEFSYPLIRNDANGGCTVSARALCKRYTIDYEKMHGRRNVRWDSKHQMVVFSLNDENLNLKRMNKDDRKGL